MKKRTLLLLTLLIGFLFGCRQDTDIPAAVDGGLSLYWDHEVFGTEGRRYRFEFSTQKSSLEQYDLIFQKTISGNTITARLVDAPSKGQCPTFPGTGPECTSRGRFYISDKEIAPGTYQFNLVTPTFSESGQLMINPEKATLELGVNARFTSSVSQVFPIPRQVLFGSIVYSGSDNTKAANDLIAYLATLGVTPATLPNYPYRHLNVTRSAHLATTDWPVDNHSIALLYSMNRSFRDIIGDVKAYVDKTDKRLSVYLYSSSGGEVRLSSSETVLLYGSEE